MRENIQSIKNEALSQIMEATSAGELEEIRINYLGRNGKLTLQIKDISSLDETEKKEVGLLVNEIKTVMTDAIATQKIKLNKQSGEWFDPTIPGKKPKSGHLHLVTQAINEISNVFGKIGFTRARYPEVEWDWFSFEALNIPKGHPARDTLETFFLDTKPSKKYGEMVLTPHTSSGQVRELQRIPPPIRMINIAKCYRRQSDVSHVPMFHQFEGLVVDEGISIVNLKGTLDYFAKSFFGVDRKTRLRPYHFQFTEPSFEVDITCGVCKGKGILAKGKACKLCKAGWLELGGAGMVHPNVLRNGGVDASKFTGFAFGWGVERALMMKSGLELADLRLLYTTDLRFLKQF